MSGKIIKNSIQSFLLLCLMSLNAQANVGVNSYSAFSDDQKLPLFIEDFLTNHNNWYLGIKEEVWFENLSENTLIFQSYEEAAKEDFKEVFINEHTDFEIELKIRLDKGRQNEFYGLQWGKSATLGKQFDFFVNGQGQFTIDKFTGDFYDFVPVTSSDLINNYSYNTLTVRKVGDRYYFFINQQLVHEMPFETFFGNEIGFQVAPMSAVQIDYLHVFQLCNGQKATQPKVTIGNQVFKTGSGKITSGQPVTMTFTVENTSELDANNLKLRYKLPSSVMLLESKSDLKLPAGSAEELELVFYLNKDINIEKIPITITVEGAELAASDTSRIELSMNQEVEATNTAEVAQYRGNDPLKGLGAEKAMQEVSIGRYFALIIGIDKYSGEWKPLSNAVNDAKAVQQQLSSKYEFYSVRTLFNEQATRANILNEYEWLMANIKENDNLLIFYSGHGDYNEALQKGFWVPVDAKSSAMSGLIANSDIQSFLSGIKSKHTLLIADACFSGSIFRGKTLTIPYENSFKYYNQVYSKPSRSAITSGGIEPVMDGGKEGHSIFTYYLLKSLSNNQNQFFDGSQLYNDLKVPVINNSNQTPGFSPIVNTGDEGGQFIFVKKQDM